MYCTARRGVLPSLSQEQCDALLAEAALHSVSEMFEAVPVSLLYPSQPGNALASAGA